MSKTTRPSRRPNLSLALVARSVADELEPRRLFAAAPWASSARLVGLDALQADAPTITGSGQTVAIIDTGIDYTQPGLGGGIGFDHKVLGGYDFVDHDADPMDDNGHGTAVAGIIAASRYEAGGFTQQGIAPDARLVALRVGADTSSVPLDRIDDALKWVIANAAAYKITVVNLSFGFGTFDSPHAEATLSPDLATLASMNIGFVASSGNDGLNDGVGITYPAADANAFSVGSVNSSDSISEFTQRGKNLDLLAPGESVYSVQIGGGFSPFSGTSFAAPAVAGAFALLRQVDNAFTLGDVRSMFRAGSPINHDGDNETGATTGYDYQRLDVDRVVRLALQRKGGTATEQAAVGASGTVNKFVYDAEGVEHLVYYDDAAATIKYATRSLDGNWSAASTIDTSVPKMGTAFSLQLDSYGRPRLAYVDDVNGDLKFGRDDGAGWTTETLDSKGVTGLYPSLAIDSADRMFLSYFRRTSYDLREMTYDPATDGWTRSTIDSAGSVGWGSSLTLDRNGQAQVAYGDYTTNALKLAILNGDGSWTTRVADASTNGVLYTSLAFDESNRARISYYESYNADLKYAAYTGSTWNVQRIASKGATGLYTNLRLDDDGRATILFWDRRTNSVQRAIAAGNGASKWKVSRLVTNAGKYVSATDLAPSDDWTYAASTGTRLIFAVL